MEPGRSLAAVAGEEALYRRGKSAAAAITTAEKLFEETSVDPCRRGRNFSRRTARMKAPLRRRADPRHMSANGSRCDARSRLARLVRYGSVSAVSTATGLTVLGMLVGVFGVQANCANVIAVAVGTVPSFMLNRRWVFSYSAPASLVRQVLPYCSLSLAGLVLTTVSVHLVSGATAGSSRELRTASVEVANLVSYGALWLIQFVLCDRILFRVPAPGTLATGAGKPPDERARHCPRADPNRSAPRREVDDRAARHDPADHVAAP